MLKIGIKGDLPSRIDGKKVKAYIAWGNLLKRVYCPKYQAKHPTYIGCKVCPEWLHYIEFKKWFDKYHVEGYALDKDILVEGNKTYSPETCVYIPQEINKLFTDKKSGQVTLTGVTLQKDCNKFKAQITMDSKTRYLGLFDTEIEASEVYQEKRKEYLDKVSKEYYSSTKINKRTYTAIQKRIK